MNETYQELETFIGYAFKNPDHLACALTHRSYRYEYNEIETDNQRLEFLGDAVLGLLAADYLYTNFPDMQEGQLTRIRSSLANGRTLAKLGERWKLGDFLLLGKGELQSGGNSRPSNLTDCLEAVLGAIYLDGGMEKVREIFMRHFVPELDSILKASWTVNPKGALQELAQGRWKVGPKYRIVREVGPPHAKLFTSEVSIDGVVQGTGTGHSKQISEIFAAQEAMEKLLMEAEAAPE
ncbi:MAG: ribonuclease III [Spartobacteria bacterium]|nr:ribonuclease III [Spartobacteria bacterium]